RRRRAERGGGDASGVRCAAAGSGREKAEGRRQKAEILAASISAFCLLLSALRKSASQAYPRGAPLLEIRSVLVLLLLFLLGLRGGGRRAGGGRGGRARGRRVGHHRARGVGRGGHRRGRRRHALVGAHRIG